MNSSAEQRAWLHPGSTIKVTAVFGVSVRDMTLPAKRGVLHAGTRCLVIQSEPIKSADFGCSSMQARVLVHGRGALCWIIVTKNAVAIESRCEGRAAE